MTNAKTQTNFFVKLPNNLFYIKDELKATTNETSLLKKMDMDSKTVLVLDSMQRRENRRGISYFSIGDMIESFGLKPRPGKGGINEAIRGVLIKLQNFGLISIKQDLEKAKLNDLLECRNKFMTKLNDKDSEYFEVYDWVRNRIYNYKTKEKIDRNLLYIHYCYLRCRMFKRSKDVGDVNGGDVFAMGGKPEYAHPGFELIAYETGLAIGSIAKYNDILEEMNLIRYDSPGGRVAIKDPFNNVKESPNCYVFARGEEGYENMMDKELKKAIENFMYKTEEDWYYTGQRVCKKDNMSRDGYINRITALERDGKATAEQINKRDSMKAIKMLDTEHIRRKFLFEENEGMLLSDIADDMIEDIDEGSEYYESYYWHKVSIKYLNEEVKKGLIVNSETEKKLIVSYEDYVKAMLIPMDKFKREYVIKEDVATDEVTAEEDFVESKVETIEPETIQEEPIQETESDTVWGEEPIDYDKRPCNILTMSELEEMESEPTIEKPMVAAEIEVATLSKNNSNEEEDMEWIQEFMSPEDRAELQRIRANDMPDWESL